MSDRNTTGEGNGKRGKRGGPFDGGDVVPGAAFRKKRHSPGADREDSLVPIDPEPASDISDVESEVERLSKKMGTKFLSEEEREDFLSGVGELRHVESFIHNVQEDIRIAKKKGSVKPGLLKKLEELKQEKKTLVESMKEREQAIRSALEQALSGVQSELEWLKGLPGFETDSRYVECLADLRGIEDAIGALEDFIEGSGQRRGGVNQRLRKTATLDKSMGRKIPDASDLHGIDPVPETAPASEAEPVSLATSAPEVIPVPDNQAGKKENAVDRSLLETSIRSIESRLQDLEKERLEAEESLRRVSAYPEHMKGLKASLGFFLKSNEEILGKLRAEEAVFQERLRVLDEGISREGEALSMLRAQLEAMDASVAFAAEPVIRTPAASTKEAMSALKMDVPRGVAEKEKEATTVDMSVDVSRRFYEQFKINKSDLLLLEGFSDLTKEQQLFVFENLRQIAVGRISEESETVVREQEVATRARVGEALGGGKIGKVGEGLFGGLWNYVSRNYREAKSEKTSAEQVMTGGIDVHGDVLRQLVEGMKERDLQVVDRDGVLEVQFLQGALQGLSPEADGSIGKFNEVANRFARIPGEWALTSVSKKQHAEYRQAKKAYDEALAEVRNELAGSGNPEHMALLLDAEGKVAMSRFLQTNPDVEQYLGSMRNRSVILEAVKRTATVENGLSFALGFARRSLLTGALVSGAVASAPVTAATGALWAATAALSGFRSAKREKEDLKKRDRSALRGAEDGKKGARNVVSAEILSGKLRSLTQKVEALASEGATSGAVPVEELKRLQARIGYTKRKAEEGLIDFSSEERDENGEVIGRIAVTNLATKYEFIKEVSLAEGVIATYLKQNGPMDGSADVQVPALSAEDAGSGPNPGFGADYDRLAERLTGYLDVREQRIDRERAAQVARKAVLGVSISSGFVIGGSALRSFLDGSAEPGLGEAIETGKTWMKKVFGGVDDYHRIGVVGGQASVPEAGRSVADATAVRGSVRDIAERSVSGRAKSSGAGSLKDVIHGDGGGNGRGAGEMAKESLPSAGPSGPKGDATIPGHEAVKSMAVDQAAGKGAKVIETASGSFEVRAETGDSVTTLARRALSGYSGSKGLTPEQRIYIESYLEKKVGNSKVLQVGSKMEFSREMLDEAIGKAKNLNAAQLENLHRYAEDVNEFRMGTGPVHVDAPVNEVPAPASSNADIPKGPSASVTEEMTSRSPKVPSAPVVEDKVPSPKVAPTESVDSNPAEKIADSTTETRVPLGSFRDLVRSEEAKNFLADPRRAEPFLKVMKSISAGLFSKEGVTGGIDERAMREIGNMSSRDVFKSCFVSIADSSRSGAITAAESEKLRRFGKFLLAAGKYGIAPEFDSRKGETFRAYMERVSVALAKNGKPASILLDSGLKDAELDERAAAAVAALGSGE
jgi:hypothetical protein